MNDPLAEVSTAINLCAGASNPDTQIASIQTYYTSDASFEHPLCYVPHSATSRRRIAGIFIFYRAVIAATSFEILSAAFDAPTGSLFVHLIQRPRVRGVVGACWVPDIDMKVVLKLRRDGDEDGEGTGKWRIWEHEDLVSLRTLFMAVPGVRWFAWAFYFLCEVLGLINAHIAMFFGVWRPVKYQGIYY